MLKNQTCLGTNQGVFQKEETKSYPNMNYKNGVTNVEVLMAPLLFQDDLIHAYESVEAVRKANIGIFEVVSRLNLNLHKDNTSCILWDPRNRKVLLKKNSK